MEKKKKLKIYTKRRKEKRGRVNIKGSPLERRLKHKEA